MSLSRAWSVGRSPGPTSRPITAIFVLIAYYVAVLCALVPGTAAQTCLALDNAGFELPVLAKDSVSSGTVFEGWAFDSADAPRVANSPDQAPQGASYAVHAP
jgi:hypothetical protein